MKLDLVNRKTLKFGIKRGSLKIIWRLSEIEFVGQVSELLALVAKL